jgi:hypothetical protein
MGRLWGKTTVSCSFLRTHFPAEETSEDYCGAGRAVYTRDGFVK